MCVRERECVCVSEYERLASLKNLNLKHPGKDTYFLKQEETKQIKREGGKERERGGWGGER